MLSVRLRTCVAGSALAVTAGVLADHGGRLGADLPELALFGVAAGAVLGLAPGRAPALRVAGFMTGLLACWLGYALRAGVLPDIPMGRALAVVAVVSIITAVATASAGRVPLWSGLLGAATLAGAYQAAYVESPPAFATESTTALTTVLLAASLGYLVALVAQGTQEVPAGAHVSGDHAAVRPTDDGREDQPVTDTASALPIPRVSDAPTTSESAR